MSFSGYGEDAIIPNPENPASLPDSVAVAIRDTTTELNNDSATSEIQVIEQPKVTVDIAGGDLMKGEAEGHVLKGGEEGDFMKGGAEGQTMKVGAEPAKKGFFLSTMFDKCTRAPWQPPKFVFPIVWTFLYTLYIIILNKTWKSESSRGSLIIGLILNLAWIPIFYFNSKAGLAVIAVMIGVAFDTSRRLELDGYHTLNNWFYSYIAWLIFAFTLNLYIALKCEN
jgi:tryptophan-rich sensory protein